MTATEAVEVLFNQRHHLSPDILRSLQDIYLCASAARYGEPHESQWAEDPEFYATHDVFECETDGSISQAEAEELLGGAVT